MIKDLSNINDLVDISEIPFQLCDSSNTVELTSVLIKLCFSDFWQFRK